MRTRRFLGLFIILSILLMYPVFLFAQATSSETTEAKKINLNFAPLEELTELPDMTPEIVEAIIENRPYEKVEDLLKITGINEEILLKFQDKIEVQKLNINSATVYELQALLNIDEELIDEELADAIIKNRPYEDIEELLLFLKLEGVSEKRLNNISDLIEANPRKEGEKAKEDKGWKTRKQNYPVAP